MSTDGKTVIFADQADMKILTYFTCMVKTSALLLFNNVMQSVLVFYFRDNKTLTLPCAASKVDIIIFWFCSKRFEDIFQEI